MPQSVNLPKIKTSAQFLTSPRRRVVQINERLAFRSFFLPLTALILYQAAPVPS